MRNHLSVDLNMGSADFSKQVSKGVIKLRDEPRMNERAVRRLSPLAVQHCSVARQAPRRKKRRVTLRLSLAGEKPAVHAAREWTRRLTINVTGGVPGGVTSHINVWFDPPPALKKKFKQTAGGREGGRETTEVMRIVVTLNAWYVFKAA